MFPRLRIFKNQMFLPMTGRQAEIELLDHWFFAEMYFMVLKKLSCFPGRFLDLNSAVKSHGGTA